MRKNIHIWLALVLGLFGSSVAQAEDDIDMSKTEILQLMVRGLDVCSSSTVDGIGRVFEDDNLPFMCGGAYASLDSGVLNADDFDSEEFYTFYKMAGASGEAIMIRAMMAKGFPVDPERRAKYTSDPYDALPDVKLPNLLCASLSLVQQVRPDIAPYIECGQKIKK